jgi:glucose/arabinose dehydrogenase
MVGSSCFPWPEGTVPARNHRLRTPLAAVLLLVGGLFLLVPSPGPASAAPASIAAGATVPAGFRDELLIGGLIEPTAVQFAPDGRIFVAEKRGWIWVYDSPGDTTPTRFANLQDQVYNNWDRGMLGMVLDPGFTTGRPYVYVAYAYNHILGQPVADPFLPRWPSKPAPLDYEDSCPNPPSYEDGCVVSSRVSRLTASGNTMVADSEKVLVEDWCQQFPSHSIGSLAFGPEGALYASGGEGASFFEPDYGQLGGKVLDNRGEPVTPANPCGDPPNPIGTANEPPSAQGGSLRAQDIRTRGVNDPVGLAGTLIRINPDTGAAWPTNERVVAGDADANARRIVAYGLRNPFRFAIRPGSGEVWIGDLGTFWWEEVNEVPNANAAPRNFGWPCFEGDPRSHEFDVLDLTMCEQLYTSGGVTPPTFQYHHNDTVVPLGDVCGEGSSSIAGLAFLGTSSGYPNQYDRALFMSDYNRRCIWWVPPDGAGRPNFSGVTFFADLRPLGEGGGAVHLTTAPNGDLVYAAFFHGQVRRIHYYGPNVPPDASFTATPPDGPLDLLVTFDASGTTDANPGDPLTYEWDLDGDGIYDPGVTAKVVTRTYTTKAQITVRLRVTDGLGASDTTTRTISPGHLRPTVTIGSPSTALRWAVGDTVQIAATGKDGTGAALPESAYAWAVHVEHCPSDCHSHPPFDSGTGSTGSFVTPPHDYPSHLRLTVTVTSDGLTATAVRDVLPKTGIIRARSDPPGLSISLAGKTGAPPPDATAIVGATVNVAAPLTATLGVTQYEFDSWSDGGAAVHGAVATEATKTLTARYRAVGPVTEYRAVDPARILDTRAGNGLIGPFNANTARTFQVTGRGGVPAGAVAVTGNLTITRQTGSGHVALTPTPTNTPPASNLNFPVGVNRASVVTATLGPGGKLSAVYVSTAGQTAHLVFDVTGYFTASASGGTYRPLDPVRLLDTRSGNGLSGPFVVGTRRAWSIAGRGGIPTAATAITANLTVANPSAAGHVTLYPAGAPTTTTSTLNFAAGETAANGVAIRLGSAGRLSAAMSGPPGATTHLILDVTGYFVDDDGGARYVPLYPGRRLDTRIGLGLAGRFQANVGRTLPVTGNLGVPSGAVAINGTLTVTAATVKGHLALLRTAANTAPTSTLNFVAGENRANGFFGRLSTGGSVGIVYIAPSGATTHVVLDLAGYFR